MLKKYLKKPLLFLLYFLYRKNDNNSLKILAYHRITQELDLHDPLKVSIDSFDKQIQYLKKHYTILSGERLLNIINANEKLPKKSCLITFDDGWMDNYTNALPVLKKYRVPAIIFISTAYIGSNKIFWHERLQRLIRKLPVNMKRDEFKPLSDVWPEHVIQLLLDTINAPLDIRYNKINELIHELKNYGQVKINEFIEDLLVICKLKEDDEPLMLTWDQVLAMSENGFEIGSHTVNHTILTQVDDDRINYELLESKKTIENKLNRPVYYFSYPNGDYRNSMMNMVERAGYNAAFAMVTGKPFSSENLFEIKRYMLRENTISNAKGRYSEMLFKIELSGIRSHLKNKLEKSPLLENEQ